VGIGMAKAWRGPCGGSMTCEAIDSRPRIADACRRQTMETMMTDVTALVDRYVATWNETDPARRRELIAGTYVEAASYVDPLTQTQGRDGIDAMIQAVQAQFPGHRFRRRGDVDAHSGRVRFAWELGPEDGPALVAGIDFGVIAADGRFEAMTGFIDGTPPARLAA
jgi:hypothetical protein